MKSIIISSLVLISTHSWALSNFAIYGQDDRREVVNEHDPKILELTNSVAARIHKSHLRKFLPSEKRVLSESSPNGKMCSGEQFTNQLRLASCSGVLVAQDKILTANHCIPDQKTCDDYRFVFDYKMKDSSVLDSAHEKKENIYQCKSILKFSSSNAFDYSLIQLDRKVSDNRKPVKISRDALEPHKDELLTIGFPSGLSMKIADNAYVLELTDKGYFTNLDTFSGNSGSPVFKKATGEVIGMVLAGKQDYIFDKENKCLKVNKCDSNGKNCDVDEPYLELVLSSENFPKL